MNKHNLAFANTLRFCACIFLVSFLFGVQAASAQDLSDTTPLNGDSLPSVNGHAVLPGNGALLSDSVIFYPKAAVEGGYVSNVFYEQDGIVAASLLRFSVLGTLKSVEGGQGGGDAGSATTKFSLGARFSWEQYLSSNTSVKEQSNFGTDINGGLIIFPNRPFTITITDRFVRTTHPTNFESTERLARDVNSFSVGFKHRPYGGTLSWGLGYRNLIDNFESAASGFADRISHNVNGRVEWKLFPVTQLSLDANFGFYDGLGSSSTKVSSTPLRVRAGISTALTVRTFLSGYVGYGNSFYSSGSSFSGVIGGARFGYRYSPMGRLSIGYQREFKDSANSNYFQDHAVTANIRQQVSQLIFSAQIAARLRNYQGIAANIGDPTRDDVIINGQATLHYLFSNNVSLSGRLAGAVDETDYVTAPGLDDDPSFSRLEFLLGLTVAY